MGTHNGFSALLEPEEIGIPGDTKGTFFILLCLPHPAANAHLSSL